MDFDRIMNQWLDSEKAWEGFEKDDTVSESSKAEQRMFLKRLPPEAEIDLHGCTVPEAERLLGAFLQTSVEEGLRKVLIIHGKGKHSENGPILAVWVRSFLDKCRFCGETGIPEKKYGGRGATWVILNRNKK